MLHCQEPKQENYTEDQRKEVKVAGRKTIKSNTQG